MIKTADNNKTRLRKEVEKMLDPNEPPGNDQITPKTLIKNKDHSRALQRRDTEPVPYRVSRRPANKESVIETRRREDRQSRGKTCRERAERTGGEIEWDHKGAHDQEKENHKNAAALSSERNANWREKPIERKTAISKSGGLL